MRLNHELVRDIMLSLEKHQEPNQQVKNDILRKYPELKDYGKEELFYHLNRLEEANFLNVSFVKGTPFYIINSITYEGHLFIDDIRDPKAWKFAKDKTKELASVSLPMLAKLSGQYIKEQLGL